MKTCPHCGGKGKAKPKPQEEVLDVSAEEGSEIDLSPKSPVRTRKLPEREPGKPIPGYHGTPNVPEGSDVDLGALPGAGPGGVVMPGSESGIQQEGSEVNLGSLSAFMPKSGAPKVVMPGSTGKIPASQKPTMAGSMLSSSEPQATIDPGQGPSTLDPRAAKPATPGQKTMLAGHMDLDIAEDELSALKQPGDPKGARPPAQAAPPTPPSMLAEGGEQPVAENQDPKATRLSQQQGAKTALSGMEEALPIEGGPKATKLAATGAKGTQLAGTGAPKMTQLAGAEEMEASLTEEEKAKKTKLAAGQAQKTQLAAGASPHTKLAKPEEQDQLSLPEKRTETQLAAGATPMTKLAKPDEQDLLKLPEPPEAGEADPYATVESQMPALEESYQPESTEAMVEDRDLEKVHGKAPKPRYGRRLIAGGLIGMFVGGAAAIALLLFDVVSLDQIKGMVGMEKSKPKVQTVKVSDDTFEGAVALLEGGKFEDAIGLLTKLPESPDTLARRGQARWLLYLRDQTAKNAKFSGKDEPVADAKKDLTAAKNAEGDFWLAHIEEITSGAKAGRDLYSQGAAKYKDNARQAQMFQSAIDRLDSASEGAGGAWLNVPGDQVAPVALFFMLQNPVAVAGTGDDSSTEAGGDFWKAARLYKEKKYDEAVEALKRARDTHAKRRYSRLGRSQNPTTDPTEDIFLRSCDELIYLAQAQKMAKDQGYADLASAIKAAQDKEAAKTLAAFYDALKKDKDVMKADPDLKDPVKSMGVLVDSKKKSGEALEMIKDALGGDPKDIGAEASKALKDYKKKTDDLDAIAKMLMPGKYVTDDQPNPVKGVDALVKAKKDLDIKFDDLSKKYAIADGIVQGVKKRLIDKKYLALGAESPEDIFKGVEKLIKEAEAPVVMALQRVTGAMGMIGRNSGGNLASKIDLGASLAASEASNASYAALLMQSHTPKQMLDLWLPLLDDRDRKDVADGAVLDGKRVRTDRAAPAELKAEAACVEGLGLRNQGKYDEARAAVAEAVKGAGQAPWRKYAVDAQAELTDPTAYYLPRADALRSEGKFSTAINVLDRGAGAFPEGPANGQILAARAVVALHMAKAKVKGPLDKNNPDVAAAAKDAQAALAAGAKADANYALGRIAEELGDYATAHKSFRAAVAAHPDGDRAGSRYRLALARVLLRIPDVAPAEEEEKDKGEAKDKKGAAAPAEFFPLAAALVVGAAADDDGEDKPTPEIDEAIRLADEAIKAGNPEGHLVKGLALARKGLWTEGLVEYTKGLEKLGKDPEHTKGLRYLMENHPAFRIPGGIKPSNPLEAEKHYALGLRLYWSRSYDQAEKEFLDAIRNQDQDARYLYFLGLTQLAQHRRSFAIESFRRGGTLEQQNRPASATISMTLERVQGPDRLLLNRYRP
jgi:tetratricopeptide (TPR) repeat protein